MALSGAEAEQPVLVVVGTRPEAIKLAPVIMALRELRLPPVVCMTGQHPELAAEALRGFGISADRTLSLMRPGQRLAAFHERAVVALAMLFEAVRPRWVVVQGDTSSALCAAISARQAGIRIAHVEAGLRSFDAAAPFPEELNRTLISGLAHLHFAPTSGARRNLLAEGIDDAVIEVTGNSVVDALRWTAAQVPAAARLHDRRLILATVHRRENRGAPLRQVVAALAALAARGDVDVVLPIHPGSDPAAFSGLESAGVRLLDSLPYPEFVALAASAFLIITDSGGVQEEASALGVPTLIVRSNTERPEVIEAGTAKIVGTATADIVAAAERLLGDPAAHRRMAQASTRMGDGHAGLRIAGRLQRELMPARVAA